MKSISKMDSPPGFSRRIIIHPEQHKLVAGLEDDVHHFEIRLAHDGTRVTALETTEYRYPWSTCPGAGDFLKEKTVGAGLSSISSLEMHKHCTHLLDLAILAARHAFDSHASQFDMFVADREGARTYATLQENGREVVRWQLEGTMITESGIWRGKDLKKLSVWKNELSDRELERAQLLRRAAFVSGVRKIPENFVMPPKLLEMRQGACFRYQVLEDDDSAYSTSQRKDFSQRGEQPLRWFTP